MTLRDSSAAVEHFLVIELDEVILIFDGPQEDKLHIEAGTVSVRDVGDGTSLEKV